MRRRVRGGSHPTPRRHGRLATDRVHQRCAHACNPLVRRCLCSSPPLGRSAQQRCGQTRVRSGARGEHTVATHARWDGTARDHHARARSAGAAAVRLRGLDLSIASLRLCCCIYIPRFLCCRSTTTIPVVRHVPCLLMDEIESLAARKLQRGGCGGACCAVLCRYCRLSLASACTLCPAPSLPAVMSDPLDPAAAAAGPNALRSRAWKGGSEAEWCDSWRGECKLTRDSDCILLLCCCSAFCSVLLCSLAVPLSLVLLCSVSALGKQQRMHPTTLWHHPAPLHPHPPPPLPWLIHRTPQPRRLTHCT